MTGKIFADPSCVASNHNSALYESSIRKCEYLIVSLAFISLHPSLGERRGCGQKEANLNRQVRKNRIARNNQDLANSQEQMSCEYVVAALRKDSWGGDIKA